MDGTTRGLLFQEETFQIRGAAFEVYRAMGAGFLEGVYQECLALEFVARGIPFQAQSAIHLEYKGQGLRQTYVADFVCYGSIVLELKAIRELVAEHRAQLLNYLHATRMRVGILANFGSSSRMQIERFAL